MKKMTSDLILGMLMLAMATFYLVMTLNIPRRGTIDATFVPFLLSGGIYILGTIQVVSSLIKQNKKPPNAATQKEATAQKVDTPTAIKTLILLVIYIALLDKIGFVIMSAVYLFAQFIVLTPVSKRRNYLLYAIVAISSSVIIYVIFRYVFDLMLPGGLLK